VKHKSQKQPEDTGTPPLMNRTGKDASPIDSAAQAKNAEETPIVGQLNGGSELASVRAEYEASARPVGTMPIPMSPKGLAQQATGLAGGKKPNVFLDKLSERLAFERSGTRLYEGVIAKLDARGTFPNGPTREALVAIHDEELKHFKMLSAVVERLGADPTVMSPCADVGAVASSGLVQVIADPRTTLPQALHAILIAELVDTDGWQLLIDLCEDLGHDELMADFQAGLRRAASIRRGDERGPTPAALHQNRSPTMRIHHLNAISTCPLGGVLIDGVTVGLRGRLTCHCLLVESASGLLLVDTGLGLRDVEAPRDRLSKFFLFLVRPDLRAEMTAHQQILRLGYRPSDVRDIVLTHLDFDHAGGLDDFPRARVHLLTPECDAATARPTWLDRQRYRPAQWGSRDRWVAHDAPAGEGWLGFEGAVAIPGTKDEVLLVPLLGHTFGHAGVAVRGASGWNLLAGDAYFDGREMDLDRPRCTAGLRFYQWMMEKDRPTRLANQTRLRELKRARGDEITIFSSHDVPEFERLSGRMHDVPIQAGATRSAPQAASPVH
jgi:glyoxylase-like metal-dependent hydrolase (beta-lactamase superfamily II)